MTTVPELIESLRGGLVVSCQAGAGSPLRDPRIIARLALSADIGGAVGLRVDSADDIRAVRQLCQLPLIGLSKQVGGYRPLITTSFNEAARIVAAGADIVAVEVSPDVPGSLRLIRRVCRELDVPVLADVATVEAGRRAVDAGAALVASTLSGYLARSMPPDEPDLSLVSELAQLGVPVLAEGRYRTRDEVVRAFGAGAHAVVVGSAITDPVSTTRWFAEATPAGRRPQ